MAVQRVAKIAQPMSGSTKGARWTAEPTSAPVDALHAVRHHIFRGGLLCVFVDGSRFARSRDMRK
jgi:hypothetical protein